MAWKKKLICTVAIIATIVYAVWRIVYTLPWEYSIPEQVAGILLLVAEIIGFLEAIQYFIGMAESFEPDCPEVPKEEYPEIDVLIPTYDEPYDILVKTINGAVNMDYPDKRKVHIYICDDTDREWVKELADKFHVGYFRRDSNEGAKAGNLNHALKYVNSELVAIFDADMIPMHDFLTALVPYFFLDRYQKKGGTWVKCAVPDRKQRVGFIQSPQGFYNMDLFQYNLYAENIVPNEQDFFFRTIQLSRNCTNAAIFAGSNAILSRQALDEVGGFYTKAITEDLATGLLIQSRKYKGYSTQEVHASGLSPKDLQSLFRQRERWARGTIQTFRQIPVLLKRGLGIRQRISYLATLLYWYTPIRKFIFIMAPILCGLFGWIIIKASWKELLIFWLPYFVLYNFALRTLSSKVRSTRLTNIYDTILFPKLVPGILLETFGIRKRKFSVTKKEQVQESVFARLRMALPHIFLAALTMAALFMSIWLCIVEHTFVYLIVIFWEISNLYDLFFAILFLLGRDIRRASERFDVAVPVEIELKSGNVRTVSANISEGGISFYLEFPKYIPEDEEITLNIQAEVGRRYFAKMKAKVVHVAQIGRKWRYSMSFLPADEENQFQLYGILYDRTPCHPTEMKEGAVHNIIRNLKKRSSASVLSNRKLPRIKVNKEIVLKNRRRVKLVNFNYEYMVVQFEYDTIPSEIKVMVDEENDMECRLVKKDGKRGLYHIDNYHNIADNYSLERMVLRWVAE